MVINCAAIGCTNTRKKDSNISFHRIPPDTQEKKHIRKLWLTNLRREPPLPKDSNFYVCSNHFEKDCFLRDLQVNTTSLFIHYFLSLSLYINKNVF